MSCGKARAVYTVLRTVLIVALLSTAGRAMLAQVGWVARFQDRASAAQVNQPHWATPLVTSGARIDQGIRADFIRQSTSGGDTVWNYGGTRGIQIIPFARTEFRVSPPPFLTHSGPELTDGFGDMAVRVKYRLYGSNEQHHNAIATAVLASTIPLPGTAYGTCCAVLTPSLELGKGFGKLALTTSAAATLPVSGTAHLGRSIALNSAIQYQLTHLLWVETEINTTRYVGGKNDGREQTFTTPGLIVSRIPLTRASASRPRGLLVTFGAGEQIALTHFHTYDHSPVFSARLRF